MKMQTHAALVAFLILGSPLPGDVRGATAVVACSLPSFTPWPGLVPPWRQ
jgi:hypothetical protein